MAYKNKHGWNKKLGTSKREQGIFTPKAPRYKRLKNGKLKCHCLFRGKELWQECWPHIQTRIIIARMREELQRQQEENDKKKDTK
jgi:hypothetical protein